MKGLTEVLLYWQIIGILVSGQSEITQNSPADDVLVSMTSNDFSSLLESESVPTFEHTNGTELFYSTFTQFLVHFDHECTTGEANLTCISSVLSVASKLANDSTPMEIWISIVPDGNVHDLVQNVVSVISLAREESNSRLVSYLMLNYRATILNSDSVSLFKQDLGITKGLLEAHTLNDIKVGVILEPSNCRERQHHIHALDLEQDNELIFIHNGVSNEKSNSYNVFSSACVFLEILNVTRATPSIETYFDINIDPSFKTYSYEKDILEAFRNQFDIFNNAQRTTRSIPRKFVVQAAIGNGSLAEPRTSIKPVSRFGENWLHAPADFSLKHFGITLYPGDYVSNELFHFMVPLFSKFRKIIFETEFPNGNTTIQVGAGIGAFQEFLLQQEEQLNLERFSKVKMPVDIILSVGMHGENLTENVDTVKEAFLDGVRLNKEFPVIVSNVVISWDDCYEKEEVCEVNTGKFEQGSQEKTEIFIGKMQSLILILNDAHIIRDTMIEQQLEHVPSLGIIWDLKFCWEMKLLADKIDAEIAWRFANLDLAILKLSVDHGEIVTNGPEATAWKLIQSAFICEVFMDGLHPSKSNRHTGTTQRPWYLKVTGCDSSNDTPVMMTELAKFWEVMSSWAEAKGRTVYMDTAFKIIAEETKCDFGDKLAEDCKCGWWNVRQSNISNSSELLFEDIKTEALRLTAKAKDQIETREESDTMRMVYIVIASGFCAAILFAILIPLFVHLQHSKRRNLSRAELNEFFKGQKIPEFRPLPEFSFTTAEKYPYNKKIYELTPSQFCIDESMCLGHGEYGDVYRGTIKRKHVEETVAVKVINLNGSKTNHENHLSLQSFISEIKILQYIGLHKNIIAMKGAYTAKLQTGRVSIFLEICELGSIEKYLKSINTQGPVPQELFKNLERWAVEIAEGMEFLVGKKVVHADLATRNVLLTSKKHAKICDFGMSRRLYNYSEYLKSSAAPLPWRWMAPEALRKGVFNEKTDVWSFGVTLWEMFTLGDIPYGGLSWDEKIITLLECGSRLEKPRFCCDKMFGIMSECWKLDAECRPTFAELNANLCQICTVKSMETNSDLATVNCYWSI